MAAPQTIPETRPRVTPYERLLTFWEFARSSRNVRSDDLQSLFFEHIGRIISLPSLPSSVTKDLLLAVMKTPSSLFGIVYISLLAQGATVEQSKNTARTADEILASIQTFDKPSELTIETERLGLAQVRLPGNAEITICSPQDVENLLKQDSRFLSLVGNVHSQVFESPPWNIPYGGGEGSKMYLENILQSPNPNIMHALAVLSISGEPVGGIIVAFSNDSKNIADEMIRTIRENYNLSPETSGDYTVQALEEIREGVREYGANVEIIELFICKDTARKLSAKQVDQIYSQRAATGEGLYARAAESLSSHFLSRSDISSRDLYRLWFNALNMFATLYPQEHLEVKDPLKSVQWTMSSPGSENTSMENIFELLDGLKNKPWLVLPLSLLLKVINGKTKILHQFLVNTKKLYKGQIIPDTETLPVLAPKSRQISVFGIDLSGLGLLLRDFDIYELIVRGNLQKLKALFQKIEP